MEKSRRCLGCNKILNSEEMIKITKNYKTGEIVVNPDKYFQGRSVYICRNEECIEKSLKKDKIQRSLKTCISDEEKNNIKILLNRMLVVQQ